MLFSKQNSKASRVSCVPKPLQISTCGFWLACPLVWGLNTRLSHSKLILELVYLDSEHAQCYLGVGNVVQLLQQVVASQIIIGSKDLPFALMHSMVVTIVRLTPMPLQSCGSSLLTRTWIEPSMHSMTPVSSILQTFSGRIAGSCNTSPITSNQCIILLQMLFSWRSQAIALTRCDLSAG